MVLLILTGLKILCNRDCKDFKSRLLWGVLVYFDVFWVISMTTSMMESSDHKCLRKEILGFRLVQKQFAAEFCW